MAVMKKTYYYSFLPNKKEELALTTNREYQVSRTLCEIRDDNPNPTVLPPTPSSLMNPGNFDPNNNPWKIRKHLEAKEVTSCKIHLTHYDVFEYVFRYSSLESANNVVTGHKVYVKVCDKTDENTPVIYGPFDEQTFFEKGLQDEYVLGLNVNLIKSRGLRKGDEIGVFYDPRSQVFNFKVFR